jgi:hypothetical protein
MRAERTIKPKPSVKRIREVKQEREQKPELKLPKKLSDVQLYQSLMIQDTNNVPLLRMMQRNLGLNKQIRSAFPDAVIVQLAEDTDEYSGEITRYTLTVLRRAEVERLWDDYVYVATTYEKRGFYTRALDFDGFADWYNGEHTASDSEEIVAEFSLTTYPSCCGSVVMHDIRPAGKDKEIPEFVYTLAMELARDNGFSNISMINLEDECTKCPWPVLNTFVNSKTRNKLVMAAANIGKD